MKSSITGDIRAHCYYRDTRSGTVTGGSGSGAHSPGGSAAVVSVKTPEEVTVVYIHRGEKRHNIFRAVKALYDSLKPISTVLFTFVWLPEASLLRIPMSHKQLCNMSPSGPQV